MSGHGQATNPSQAAAYIPMQPDTQPVIMTATLPVSLQPYSFYKLSLIIMIMCFVINMTSLIFGIPSFVFSMKSEQQKQAQQYVSAKRSGAIALTLTVINMIYTFTTICLTIGLLWGLRALHVI